MKTFQQFCEPKTKKIGAPVEDVSPTITRWANEYGEYCAGYEGEIESPQIKRVMPLKVKLEALSKGQREAIETGLWKLYSGDKEPQ